MDFTDNGKLSTCTLTTTQNNVEFALSKVNGNDWQNSNGATEVELGKAYTIAENKSGANWTLKNAGTYLITLNTETNQLTVTDPNESGEPTPFTGDIKIKFGNGNSDWNEGVAMTKDSDWSNNHKWHYTFDNCPSNRQLVIIADKEYKHNSATFNVSMGVAYKLYADQDNNQNFQINGNGSDSYIVTVDASDKDNLTVTVTEKEEHPRRAHSSPASS